MIILKQLQYFIAVAKTENVGKAAEELFMTQSPLSRQIIDLEEKLGLTLFHRNKNRLKLTSAGKDFLKASQELLEHSERVEAKANSLALGHSGSLTIGYVEGALHCGVLGSALKPFIKKHPDVEIKMELMRSSKQFECLLKRQIDIALTYSVPTVFNELDSHKVFSEKLKLAAPKNKGWPKEVSPIDLEGESIIWLPSAQYPIERDQLMNACASLGFYPDIRVEATSPLAAMEMVDAGLGLAFIQASLQRIKPNNVVFHNMPSNFLRDVDIHVAHPLNPTMLVKSFMEGFN